MQKWEYCVFTAYETSTQTQFIVAYQDKVDEPKVRSHLDVFAGLGREGWELVAVHPLDTGLKEFYFKRPILER